MTFTTPGRQPMTDAEIEGLLKHVDDMVRRGVRLSPRTSAELAQAVRDLQARIALQGLTITLA